MTMPFKPTPSTCPICQEQKEFSFIRDHHNKDGQFSLYECKKCEIQFWIPFKNAGEEWYEKEYDCSALNVLTPKISSNCHKKFLQNFKNLPKNTRILDIACGTGEFLAELQSEGCEVWGVDFNRNHIEIAKNRFGLKNVFAMDFGDFLGKEDLPQFDIITFFGLLEHIDNPLELVRKIKRILKPDGFIATSAPTKENLVANMHSLNFPPHHLSRWNKKSISSLFKEIDFTVFHIEYVDQFRSFVSALTDKFRFGLVNKTAKKLDSARVEKKKSAILIKSVYLLGDIKNFVIGTVPAIFLFILSWILRRKGQTMFVILKRI
jgi:2-polyprenyl-3-methyl-5-hydroxy-6-metoxy-1,4-benzoquinol methylase